MKRNFNEWIKTFKSSLSNYNFYVNFEKVYKNVKTCFIELNILNSLIGSKNIENDFKTLLVEYPKVLNCIPILLAVRNSEIFILENNTKYTFNFDKPNYSINEYSNFMEKSGLFNLLSNHLISNIIDYVTGVEVGLDSNSRKNRGGHLMENLVEHYIKELKLIKNKDYFKEIYISDIESKWNYELSSLSNGGKIKKRFDFVIKKLNTIYAIETSFYSSSGSKLNETARSYKLIALNSKKINNFEFIWITDGKGWLSTLNNLYETFEVLNHIYCINDLQNGILKRIIK